MMNNIYVVSYYYKGLRTELAKFPTYEMADLYCRSLEQDNGLYYYRILDIGMTYTDNFDGVHYERIERRDMGTEII